MQELVSVVKESEVDSGFRELEGNRLDGTTTTLDTNRSMRRGSA
jgi:hypothetical protein